MSLLHLSENTLAAANLLGSWLAQNDFTSSPDAHESQLVVMAGMR